MIFKFSIFFSLTIRCNLINEKTLNEIIILKMVNKWKKFGLKQIIHSEFQINMYVEINIIIIDE